jgi:hypothetical protein
MGGVGKYIYLKLGCGKYLLQGQMLNTIGDALNVDKKVMKCFVYNNLSCDGIRSLDNQSWGNVHVHVIHD